jgi:hypothetical protein
MPRSKTIDALRRAELTNYNNVGRSLKMAAAIIALRRFATVFMLWLIPRVI